jgi:RNA polymerase sigma-70 factor (ECF subfamily)
MKLRGEKNYKTYSEDTLSSLPIDDTELAQIREINLNTLEACLAALNNEQKSCITLFYLQKNSYQEITEKTGYSLLQVKSYVQNGKRNLKMLMEKKRKIE